MKNVGQCYKCKVVFWLPDDLYTAARRDPNITFYCPHGHPQHFEEGETEADKYRREAERLRQQLARRDDEIATRARQLAAAKGQITRARKRAAAGTCPCCNRTFSQLARHMQAKHPNFKAEVVELKERTS